MCCCDDYDQPSVYHQDEVKARKPHKCSECCREIRKGETHVRISGLWDGRWSTFRICFHCDAAGAILRAEIDDFCYCLSGLWEAADERREGFERYEGGRWTIAQFKGIHRLIAGAARKWRHKRGPNAGQLMPVPAAREAVAI